MFATGSSITILFSIVIIPSLAGGEIGKEYVTGFISQPSRQVIK